MTDDTRAREIRAELNKLAPFREDPPLTARETARYCAMEAQVAWARTMDPETGIAMGDIGIVQGYFATAHALLALAAVDPAAADECAAQIVSAWNDGGGTGEWIYEHLGPDAKRIAALAQEMAALARETA